MGHFSSTVVLPDELAPSLRAAVLTLLAEVPLADRPPPYVKDRAAPACYFCGNPGRMGLHHVIPGDHSTVVPVHHSCHRRLHRKARA